MMGVMRAVLSLNPGALPSSRTSPPLPPVELTAATVCLPFFGQSSTSRVHALPCASPSTYYGRSWDPPHW